MAMLFHGSHGVYTLGIVERRAYMLQSSPFSMKPDGVGCFDSSPITSDHACSLQDQDTMKLHK
jgi:hypothetical protein